jgi:hypothetical protein
MPSVSVVRDRMLTGIARGYVDWTALPELTDRKTFDVRDGSMLSKKSGFDWNECFKRLDWRGIALAELPPGRPLRHVILAASSDRR